jgi:thymidylate kinase
MPDNAPVILAVDGPPGAGKTSLLARIAPAYGDACTFFTEPNARLAGPLPAPEGGSTADLSRWFLRHEQTRARQVAALSADPLTRLILCDRNHLGVLAFCHATTASDALPYDQALAIYQRDIAPNLPTELKTVILLVSPDVSLERRGGAAERPRWQQWFSRDLLGRLRDFYAGTAPGLCPSPPLVIDTDQLTPAGVAQQVQQLLPGPAAGSPPPGQSPPSAQRPAVDPVFGDLYAEAGGLEALGHPLTAPFPYRGGHVQIFQLGALYQDSNGQARLWDPLTAALPGTAARP